MTCSEEVRVKVEEDLSGGQHELEHCQIGEGGGKRGRVVGEGWGGLGRGYNVHGLSSGAGSTQICSHTQACLL